MEYIWYIYIYMCHIYIYITNNECGWQPEIRRCPIFLGGYPRIIHFIRLNPDFLIPTIYGSPPFFEWVYFRRKNWENIMGLVEIKPTQLMTCPSNWDHHGAPLFQWETWPIAATVEVIKLYELGEFFQELNFSRFSRRPPGNHGNESWKVPSGNL